MAMPPGAPILLVEDEPDDAMLAMRALRRARVHNDVIVVTDGVEALEYLFRTGPWSTSRMAAPAVLRDSLLQAVERAVMKDVRGPSDEGRMAEKDGLCS